MCNIHPGLCCQEPWNATGVSFNALVNGVCQGEAVHLNKAIEASDAEEFVTKEMQLGQRGSSTKTTQGKAQ